MHKYGNKQYIPFSKLLGNQLLTPVSVPTYPTRFILSIVATNAFSEVTQDSNMRSYPDIIWLCILHYLYSGKSCSFVLQIGLCFLLCSTVLLFLTFLSLWCLWTSVSAIAALSHRCRLLPQSLSDSAAIQDLRSPTALAPSAWLGGAASAAFQCLQDSGEYLRYPQASTFKFYV